MGGLFSTYCTGGVSSSSDNITSCTGAPFFLAKKKNSRIPLFEVTETKRARVCARLGCVCAKTTLIFEKELKNDD